MAIRAIKNTRHTPEALAGAEAMKVLVVEDDPFVREMAVRVWKMPGSKPSKRPAAGKL